jgi:DNA processing protein
VFLSEASHEDSISSMLTARPPLSPQREMGAYEALWEQEKSSFKIIADMIRNAPGSNLSDLVGVEQAEEAAQKVKAHFERHHIEHFGVRINGTFDYPQKLRDAANPVEFLYFQGLWDLADASNSVAVVGTRKPSEEAIKRCRKLVKGLVSNGYVIASGLAAGIDTAAHTAAIAEGGRTFAVLGTPISKSYPSENAALQREIAKDHLVISQVPILRYLRQGIAGNRLFFPERNVTMSALTQATIIVEAGETSGTLIQARAALKQGRKLFILDSCFNNTAISWPEKFAKLGAIRVRELNDILSNLAAPVNLN